VLGGVFPLVGSPQSRRMSTAAVPFLASSALGRVALS
jgi:hypothetical protein